MLSLRENYLPLWPTVPTPLLSDPESEVTFLPATPLLLKVLFFQACHRTACWPIDKIFWVRRLSKCSVFRELKVSKEVMSSVNRISTEELLTEWSF